MTAQKTSRIVGHYRAEGLSQGSVLIVHYLGSVKNQLTCTSSMLVLAYIDDF